MIGKILSINISRKKGEKKKPHPRGELIADYGIKGDAHSDSVRQVSFLDFGEVKNWLDLKKNKIKISYGDFAENISTEGINFSNTKIGDRIIIDNKSSELPELIITQIGKNCHSGCVIQKTIGDCIMPRAGIFTKVLKGGKIKKGEKIYLIKKNLYIQVGVLVCSDKASTKKRVDTAGPAIKEILEKFNRQQKPELNRDTIWYNFSAYQITPDDERKIVNLLKNWCDQKKLQLIFTCGGTGFSQRDVTPEATKKVIEKEVPGIPEMMRFFGSGFTLNSWLSRAISGIRKKSLIINLPGSEKAVRENLKIILPVLGHALKILSGDTEH